MAWIFSLFQKEAFFSFFTAEKKKMEGVLLFLLSLMLLSWVIATIFSPAPLTSLFGIYPRFQGFLTFITYAFFAGAVFYIVRGWCDIERLQLVITTSGFFVALGAVAQKIGLSFFHFLDTDFFLGRVFSFMGHPDYMAGYLVMVLPLIISHILARKSSRSFFFECVNLIFCLGAIFFSFSRAAWLGTVLMTVFFGATYCIKKTPRIAIVYAGLLFAVSFLFAFFIAAVNYFPSAFSAIPGAERLIFKGENLRSIETRFALWEGSFDLISRRPFVGYGFDTFAYFFPSVAPASLNTLENFGDYSDRAHNFILDYAISLGIPATVIFLSFIGFVLHMGVLSVWGEKKTERWSITLAFLSGLVGILTVNMFGFFVTTQWVYFWVFIAVILRIFLLKSVKNKAAKPLLLPSFPKILKFFLGAGMIIGGFSFWWRYEIALLYADHSFLKLMNQEYQFLSIAPENRLAFALEAVQNQEPWLYYKIFYDERMRFLLEIFPQLSGSDEILDPLENNLTASENIYSDDGFLFLLKGRFFTLREKFPEARNAFRHAITLMPNYPFGYLLYGEALLQEEKFCNRLKECRDGNETLTRVSTNAQALTLFTHYLSVSPPYYRWKKELMKHSYEEREKYRIFYKLHPRFDEVFLEMRDVIHNLSERSIH